jgi:hypothetical protein
MSRRGRKTPIGGQFAPRRIDMLRSPAYRALSLSARKVLDRLEIEMADHGGTDNGRLPVTYRNFVDYGIHRHAIYPAIREVVALGLVEITKQGVAGTSEFRRPNEFRLTYRHTDNARGDGTHEWMKISEEDAPLIAAVARAERPLQKQSLRYGKRQGSVRKPHRKQEIRGTESITTTRGTETITTFDISGRDGPAPLTSTMPGLSKRADGERPEVLGRIVGECA